MHAAALTENIDSHCSKEPARVSHCTPSGASFLSVSYNSTESQWNKAGYLKI